MIKTVNLTKMFPNAKAPAIKDINLKIENGEFISLVGRSGSGKSTLLYIISTLDKATSGEVFYDEKNINLISKPDIYQMRNKKIGFVFQFHYLIQELTALENVLLPARKAMELEKRTPLALQLLKEVGLEGLESRFPSELSGGEQQRVAIARALIMEPTYVFADEPTGNLDSINGNIIIDLFKKINQQKGTTIIYVTHDKEFAAKAERQITLVDGVLS
jgi:putative ABC transport system ATP-binding protein/lipoprotein-releasing system ATP-binding protein